MRSPKVLLNRGTSLLALSALALVAACGGTEEGVHHAAGSAAVTESSYVSDAVLGALASESAHQGKTWNVSHDNQLVGKWLFNTPLQPMWDQQLATLNVPKCTSNCDADFGLQHCATQADCTGGGTCKPVLSSVKAPGQAPVSMCVGHSDGLYEEIYTVLTSARQYADVTSLQPPDGRFLAAIRNAITYLGHLPQPVSFRLITGEFPVQGVVNTTTVLKDLARDLPSNSNIKVAVGAFRSSDTSLSWNHSKIVAVDGNRAIVGGHNLWDGHYLGIDPVNDTSVELRGSAAGDAQRFANQLWDYTCNNMSWITWMTWSVWANVWQGGSVSTGCLPDFNLPVTAGPAGSTVIAVGRLGTGIDNGGNQGDLARLALLRSAKKTIRIAQQDLGPSTAPVLGIAITAWPTDTLTALADAINRGVDVYVVVSDKNSIAGGLTASQASYSNGYSALDVAQHVQQVMNGNSAYPQGAALRSLLCSKLHVAELRYGQSAAWPDGRNFANHTKGVIIDEQAFYFASHNMYPTNLQEFGFIVDDSAATATVLSTYWSNLWRDSSVGAVSGSDAPACSL